MKPQSYWGMTMERTNDQDNKRQWWILMCILGEARTDELEPANEYVAQA
jgi:hypothetical protein